jgi:hypothetical protein
MLAKVEFGFFNSDFNFFCFGFQFLYHAHERQPPELELFVIIPVRRGAIAKVSF